MNLVLPMNPRVRSVRPLPQYRLLLEFSNAEWKIFDVTPYLSSEVFVPLRDPAVFNTVHVLFGSVEWPGEVDLSYDTLYIDGTPADDLTVADAIAIGNGWRSAELGVYVFDGVMVRVSFRNICKDWKPHVHAQFGDHEALIAIEDGSVLGGKLPPKQSRLIRTWIGPRREELLAHWVSAGRAREATVA